MTHNDHRSSSKQVLPACGERHASALREPLAAKARAGGRLDQANDPIMIPTAITADGGGRRLRIGVVGARHETVRGRSGDKSADAGPIMITQPGEDATLARVRACMPGPSRLGARGGDTQ